MRRSVYRYWLSMSVILGSLDACATEIDPVSELPNDVLTHEDLLVSIPRNLDVDSLGARTATLESRGLRNMSRNTDFFLAIHRNTLEQQWFWSMYLKQFHPFGGNP